MIFLANQAPDGQWQITTPSGAAGPRLWCQDMVLDGLGVPVRLQVIACEAIPLPVVPALPVPTLLATFRQAVAGQGALLHLRNPAQALGVNGIAYAEGVRLLGISDPADEVCWDALLSLGQPTYGMRGQLRIDSSAASAPALISALAFGNFVCEEGITLAALNEHRQGVEYSYENPVPPLPLAAQVDLTTQVIVKGGFVVATLPGPAGAWQDRGNEGYVRLLGRGNERQAIWTQPRLIAPRREAACGG